MQGNPGKRPIKKGPQYPALSDHPPDELPPLGKALWRRVVGQLGPTRVVQATDREALIVMCQLWATYRQAMDLVSTHGVLIRSKNKNDDRAAVIVNPAWRVARDASRQMEGLWASFGLTPADRARIGAGPRDARNEATREFLFGRRGGSNEDDQLS
jgi:P27 family predicted phage terminase small subunit